MPKGFLAILLIYLLAEMEIIRTEEQKRVGFIGVIYGKCFETAINGTKFAFIY